MSTPSPVPSPTLCEKAGAHVYLRDAIACDCGYEGRFLPPQRPSDDPQPVNPNPSQDAVIRVTVNGEEFRVPRIVKYESVVRLAGHECDRLWTVTFRYPLGHKGSAGGTLTLNHDYLEVRDGTVFNVADTSGA